jgi:phosphoglycolate phosphatase-like HAD superfamily hydrolase
MQSARVWRRPDLFFPSSFDTIFFDIDGILIKTIDSFHAADRAAAEYIIGTLLGLDWGQREGRSLITEADVEAFKQAGGYNNAWDLCYLLTTLFTARLREWRDTPLAERSSLEWAALSRAANLEGHGGRAWVEAVVPTSARTDYAVVGEVYQEFYWGAQALEQRFGRAAQYLPEASGFVNAEEMLFPADLPMQLRERGIRHLGMITGRAGPEVDSALERLERYCDGVWWDVIIAADLAAKPDPRALQLACETVGARGGLYVGDAADDLDVVLNYRRIKAASDPEIIATMAAVPEDWQMYQQRGADLIVEFGHVAEIVTFLPEKILP